VETGGCESTLRAAHRFRHAGRAGREDEEIEGVVGDGRDPLFCRPGGGQHVRVRGLIHGEHAAGWQVEVAAVEKGRERGFGDHDVAVGVGHELRELGPSVCRVDADRHRAAERGSGQPEEVLGSVLEEDADVRWPIGVVESRVDRGAPLALTDEVAVAPGLVLEEQRRRVVVGAAQQQIGGCRQGVVSGVRPERSGWHVWTGQTGAISANQASTSVLNSAGRSWWSQWPEPGQLKARDRGSANSAVSIGTRSSLA
jgi:hypothetical protein